MHHSYRKLLLIIYDLCCVQAAIFATIFIQSASVRNIQIGFHIHITCYFTDSLSFFNIYGLFSLERKCLSEIFLNLIVAVGNIFICALAVTFLLREFDDSRFVIIYSTVIGFILLAICQYIMNQIEVKYLSILTVFISAYAEETAKLQNEISKSYGLEKQTQPYAVCR